MKNRLIKNAVTAALASLACGAGAQTAQKPTVLPEVSVSATRVERNNMDIPASIDTIDQRAIREANPQVNLSEVLNRVPGISVLNRQNYAQDLQISSRGFGARSAFGVRGLRLIADGIPATMPDGQGQAATFNLSSAKSIEVMRGPFASMYGSSAGGVIQIFTADGPKEPTASVSALFGSYDTTKLGAQYGGQHGPLNAVVDVSRFETNGYRDHSAARRDHMNAKLKYDLGDRGVLTLVVNVFDQPETQDPLGLTAAQVAANPKQAGGNPAGANAINFNTRKSIAQSQGGLTYDLKLSGGNSLYARAYGGDRQVTQHLAIPLATQNTTTHSGGVVDLDRGYGGAALRWTHENKLAGMPFTVSAGVDYDRMAERRKGFFNNNGVTGALKRNEDNTVSNTDFYAQAEWRVTSALNLLAGLRRSRVSFESTDYFTNGPLNGNDSGAVRYSRTTPAAGITYRVTPAFNLYANIGKGFETPTFAELAYRRDALGNPIAGLNFALQPSTSLHREIGVKALLGDTGRINAALFRVDTTNEIVVANNAGGRADFKNVPGTRREGLELGWEQKYAHGFETAVSYTLLNARFTQPFSTVTGTPSAVVNVAAGSKLPGIAASNFFGELVWRHAASGFHAGVEYRHSGKIYVNDQNAESADAYNVWNLRAGLQQRGRGWKLTEFVRIDNVGNKNYIGSVIVAEANNRYYEPAPGRNFTIGISAEFQF